MDSESTFQGCSLTVKKISQSDNSIAMLSIETLDHLQLYKGDTIMLQGKVGWQTLAIVLVSPSNDISSDEIGLNDTIMKNLRVTDGDKVLLETPMECMYLTKLQIAPIKGTFEDVSVDLMKTVVIPYFSDAYRPVMKSDIFDVTESENVVQFKVIACEPMDYGIVSPTTEIILDEEAVESEENVYED